MKEFSIAGRCKFNHSSVQIQSGRPFSAIAFIANQRQTQPGKLRSDLMPEAPCNARPAFKNALFPVAMRAPGPLLFFYRKYKGSVEPLRRAVGASAPWRGFSRAKAGHPCACGAIGSEAAGHFKRKAQRPVCSSAVRSSAVCSMGCSARCGSGASIGGICWRAVQAARERCLPGLSAETARPSPARSGAGQAEAGGRRGTAEQVFLGYAVSLLLGAQGCIGGAVESEEDKARGAIVDAVDKASLGAWARAGRLRPALEYPGGKALGRGLSAALGRTVHARRLVDSQKAAALIDEGRCGQSGPGGIFFEEFSGTEHKEVIAPRTIRRKDGGPDADTREDMKISFFAGECGRGQRRLAFLFIMLAFQGLVCAQASNPGTGTAGQSSQGTAGTAGTVQSSSQGAAQTSSSAAAAKPAALPKGFRGIELGMSIDEVEDLLKKDSLFSYQGPSDVSLLPSPNMSLIEVEGISFVKRAFFQFYEKKLWVMVFYIAQDKVDHYTLYSSLSSKYGEPASIDPKEARWEDGSVRIALERPLTLRYMDLAVYRSLNESGAAKEGEREIELRDFLNGL